MYRSLKPHLVASIAALSLTLSAQASLLHLIPENTDIVVSVADVSDFVDRSQNNPLVRAWSDPAIMEWTAPLREKLDWVKFNDSMKEESGKSFEEVVAMIDGGLLVAFTGLAEGDIEQWAENPNVLFMVEVGEHEDEFRTFIEEDLEGDDEDEAVREISRENYGDAEVVEIVTTTSDEDSDEVDEERFFWSLHDGLFVLSLHRESVLIALDAQRHGGADNPFDQSRHYSQIESHSQGQDFLAYLNGQSIYRAITSEIEKKAANQPPNPMGFSPATILPALGVDRWEMLYLTAKVSEDETINHYGFTHSGEPAGLWNLMPADAGRFPEPAWLPADWHTASSMRFDLANLFTELEKIAAQISPMALGMWQGIQMQVQQNMGIDLKNNLFNTFGDEVVVAQFFEGDPGIDFSTIPFGQSPQLIAIELRDAATFRNTFNTALKTALQSMQQFMEVRDYLGQEMMVFTLPNPAIPGTTQTTAIAITDDTLFLSMFTTVPLEHVLQTLANPGAATFWDRDDVQSSMSWVPGDAMSYGLQNSAALMNQAVKTITQISVMQAPVAADAAEELDVDGNPIPGAEGARGGFADGFNHEAAPDMETLQALFGPIISCGVVDGDGFHFEARLLHVVR